MSSPKKYRKYSQCILKTKSNAMAFICIIFTCSINCKKENLRKERKNGKNCRREVSLVMHLSSVLLLKSLLLFESQWKISMRKYCDKSYDVFETNFEFRNYGI